jgi:hypothetical protein
MAAQFAPCFFPKRNLHHGAKPLALLRHENHAHGAGQGSPKPATVLSAASGLCAVPPPQPFKPMPQLRRVRLANRTRRCLGN